MKPHTILCAAAAVIVLTSCSAPTGISASQVAAVSRTSGATSGPLRFEMNVKEPLRTAVSYDAKRFEVGDRIRAGAEREFVYPSGYEPPQVTAGSQSVKPSTPRDFKNLNTGLVADLSTRSVGSAVLIEGTVTITEFRGFSRMEGEFGQPVLDSKERLISENLVEMPKFVTYTTPVCVAIQPGASSSFEISAAKKGTKMTFSLDRGE
ncbi:MAG: hypothetical protein V4640_16290 [Verrucomicrobiota bacterium]